MDRNAIIHIVGCLCLGMIAVIAVTSIVTSVAPQWRRILRLATGHIDPAFEPVPPAASGAPTTPAFPQHRGDEAAAVPALQVLQ